MADNIQDFGEKIGGARKDLWSVRGLSLSDLDEMNPAERQKFVKKDSVWKRPDYQKMMDEGLSPRVAYFIKTVRDSLPTGPYIRRTYGPEETAQAQENYIQFVGGLRDAAMALKQESDISGFYEKHIKAPYLIPTPGRYTYDVVPEATGLIDRKVLSLKSMESLSRLDRAIRLKQFGYSEDQKILNGYEFFQYDGEKARFEDDRGRQRLRVEIPGGTYYGYPTGDMANPDTWQKGTWFALSSGVVVLNNAPDRETLKQTILAAEKASAGARETAKRKGRFIPPQLEHVRFSGADFRNGRDVAGQDYLDTFRFRGGEFGNWMGERDRQVSLNMGYESLCAMAKALNLSMDDMSLNGRLAIAFGSRGQGSAAAHYEPLREVVNLTKMRGAGSLAHEWGHAMDDLLNKALGNGDMMGRRTQLTQVQRNLHDHMKYREQDVSAEEVRAQLESRLEGLTRRVNAAMSSYFPSLTGAQAQRRDDLMRAVIEDRSLTGLEYRLHGAYPKSVEALSDFRKEVLNRVIPKDLRQDLCSLMGSVNAVRDSMEHPEPRKTRVRSQYMEDSVKFDNMYGKTDHGYWQSEVEMFARAFACYTHDKLREAGITCDYAVGHAEAGPVPRGEERKLLNQDFDKLIQEFKERGLLHDYVEPERVSEQDMALEQDGPPALAEASASIRSGPTDAAYFDHSFEQVSLDDLIRDAGARAEGQNGPSREHDKDRGR